MIEITSSQDPRIAIFSGLRDLPGAFIAEGEKVVQLLLKSPLEIEKVLIKKDIQHDDLKSIQSKLHPNRIFTASNEHLRNLVGAHYHQGMMAIAKKPPITPLRDMKGPIVILEGVTNPENVGSIIRNAQAFGVDQIIVDDKTVHPYLRRCVRVSMGTIFNMKYHITSNLTELIERLIESQYEIVVTDLNPKAIDYRNYSFKPQTALVFGSEGTGVSLQAKKHCHALLRIPMSNEVDSLNVAAASAIFLAAMQT